MGGFRLPFLFYESTLLSSLFFTAYFVADRPQNKP